MAKKEYSEILVCPHCSNMAQLEIIGSVRDTEYIREDEGSGYEDGDIYELLKCPKCRDIYIRKYYWHDFMDSTDDVIYKKIFPENKNIPLGLPDNIILEYQKAEKVKPIAPEFYALSLRRILELVCIDKKAAGKMLGHQLKDLAERKEIPENLVRVAEGLKDFCNIGAHVGIGTLSSKEITIAEALCKAVLEYIYSAPYLANLAEESYKTISLKPPKPKKKEI